VSEPLNIREAEERARAMVARCKDHQSDGAQVAFDSLALAALYREAVEAGDAIAQYREHRPGCDYAHTEFCTCGRKQAADRWSAVLAKARTALKESK